MNIDKYFVIRKRAGPFNEWRYLESVPEYSADSTIIGRSWKYDSTDGFPFFTRTNAEWFIEAMKNVGCPMEGVEVIEKSWDDLRRKLGGGPAERTTGD